MIDGKKVYGAYLFTERGSEGITMGVTNVLYPMGFKYEDPKKPNAMDGFVNLADAVKGLFTSPTPDQMLAAAEAVDTGAASSSRRPMPSPPS